VDAGPREQLSADRDQRTRDAQAIPIVAFAERAQESGRMPGPER
jgi:hypothetical protein